MDKELAHIADSLEHLIGALDRLAERFNAGPGAKDAKSTPAEPKQSAKSDSNVQFLELQRLAVAYSTRHGKQKLLKHLHDIEPVDKLSDLSPAGQAKLQHALEALLDPADDGSA